MWIGPVFLAVLGIGATLVGLGLACVYFDQVSHDRADRACVLKTYYDWLTQKGTQEQRQAAEQLYRSHDLVGLKRLAGAGFLVARR